MVWTLSRFGSHTRYLVRASQLQHIADPDFRLSGSPKDNILRLYYQTDASDETSQVSDGQATRAVEKEEEVVDWEYDTSGYDLPSDEIEPCHISDDGTETSTWTAPCYLYGELKLEWVYGLLSIRAFGR